MARWVRYGLLAVIALVVLAIGAGAVFIARFDPNSLKPRIEAAVQQATGRDLALNGPISLRWSLWPTVALHDVTLANPPGFSRPQMATLQRLDLQLAVLPLLHSRFEIARLVLVHPDILLETDASGRPNWQFTPQPAAAPASPGHAAASSPGGGGSQVSVHDVRIEDGTLALRDDRTGTIRSLALSRLTATAADADAPLQLSAAARYDNVAVTLDGQVGSLARLQQTAATTPWPVKLTLAAAGAKVVVDGALTRPLQGRGYTLRLDGTIPDLAALAPLLPGTTLPPLHDLRFATQLADSGQPIPHVTAATLHLGAADLGAYVTGLHIVTIDIDAPAQNQPVRVSAQGGMADLPLTLTAMLGAPATLQSAQAAPVPVDLTLRAGNANLTVKGTLAHPETLAGADFAVTAEIADLAALSPLAHRPLPSVKQIALQGRLTDAQGGFQHGAALHGLVLTSADGDLSGDLTVAAGPPPGLTGTLHAKRIDLDALLAAAGKPVAAAPAGTAPAGTAPAGNTPAGTAPAGTAASPAPPAPQAGRLFPDTPIPFGLLRSANADLTLSIDDLHNGGQDDRAIAVHAALQGGKLHVDRFAADLPEGKLAATLSVDATAAAPPVALTLHAPGLSVAPLLAAAGLPGYASGRLEVYADLHAAGTSPHALAAGLDGSLGLAMQNGTIDTQLLNHLLGPVLQKANLLGLLAHGGSSAVQCFALRADARHGVATLRTLVLNSALLSMDGSGSVDLGAETLALHLRPQGRVAGTGIVVPLQVGGPIRTPNVAVDALGAAESNAGSVAGAVIGSATPLGLLGGALGGDKLLGGANRESCAGPLALARGQAAPAAPASAPTDSRPAPSRPTTPGGLLRQLFH